MKADRSIPPSVSDAAPSSVVDPLRARCHWFARRRSWWTALVLAALLGLTVMVPLGCAAHVPNPYRLVAAPSSGYTIEGGAVTIETSAFRITVTPLDDLARSAFIHSRAEGATDPFGSDGAGIPKYLSFRLVVENLGASEPVVFQPQSIYLASTTGDRLFPLDYPEAYSRLAGQENADPRLLDDLSKFLFDVGVSVSPGQRAEGMLVYPTRKTVARKFRMEFNFLQTGGSDTTNFDIYFVAEPRS